MKDLDFDELDRAVNSLMTNVPKTASPRTMDEDEKTLDIESTLGKDEPISFDKLDSVTAEAANVAVPSSVRKDEAVEAIVNIPNVTNSPSARRSGRFMDVVHPSSDMKKATPPTRPASRQGVTIDPVVSHKSEVSTAPNVRSTGDSVESSKASSPEEVLVADTTWPDPLAMTDFKDDTLPKEEEWNSSSKTSAKLDNEPAPLTSPFLPDTKVEKRPLGAGVSSSSEDIGQVPESTEVREDKTIDDPNAQLPANPGDIPQQLPEELQSDLMSVEADTHMGVPKTEQTHPLEAKSIEPGLPSEQDEIATPTTLSGPVSIPQQYHEEPSTGDQKSGSIYDTDTYHRPLDHPAKKKSGWMWIVWIFLIILVGAGIGAGVFFAFLS